jgi:hypothetical protein
MEVFEVVRKDVSLTNDILMMPYIVHPPPKC